MKPDREVEELPEGDVLGRMSKPVLTLFQASVKVGGVPQCSGEVEHCGTLGTPALFQSSVEWCGTAWNGCALTTPVTPCHHLSTLGTEKY